MGEEESFRPRFCTERIQNMIKRVLSFILLLTMLPVALSSCGERVKTRDLTWAVGSALPPAEAFFEELSDGYSARYAEEYSFNDFKTYSLDIILTSPMGGESRHEVKLTLTKDETPPTLEGLCDFVAYINGGGISYLSGVVARDNCDGEVTLDVDSSHVNLKEEGVYPVTYTATDAVGNRSVFHMTVTVLRQEITREMLFAELEEIADAIIHSGMTKTEMLREVYDFVRKNVSYTSIADKSSWISAAYEGLTTGKGDCYTYFALSKAFFEYLEIENTDVKRAQEAEIAAGGVRHFWNMVNLGTEEDPRWYHFDACLIKELPDPWGFLMTDHQLSKYMTTPDPSKDKMSYFYCYDKESVPASAKEIITRVN